MNSIVKWVGLVLLGFLMALQSSSAADQLISGSGSTAAALIYRSWAEEYNKAQGIAMNYEASGSSAGMKKIRERVVDFGATDVAPSDAELSKDGLVVFPIAITGIAPVVNLPNLASGQLRLTGPLLARIFLGEIKFWNSSEIAQLNPGLNLPRLPIKIVVRSDGSGTTYNFADYLAKISTVWKDTRGVKNSINWHEGVLSARGNGGVVEMVKLTTGAISYVDFTYVLEHQLNAAQMMNAEGEFLKPSNAAFRAALKNSDWVRNGNFTTTLTNKQGRDSWPLTMGTFAVVPKISDNVEQTQRALRFFVWAFTHGDLLVQKQNFVRLPDRVQAAAFRAISSIKDKAGKNIGMSL
jgi:phosphate transport system substrate-binding protein